MSSSIPLHLPSHIWLHLSLFLLWQERLVQATHLCKALPSPASTWGEHDHLRLTVPVFDALCSFNRSATRALSSAPSVSIDEDVAADILRDGDAPLRTLLTSLSQLPDADPPLLSVRSLYAGGEFVQCALDCHLPLCQLSSLSLQPVTRLSEQMLVRNRLWCALFELPKLKRLQLDDYVLTAVDHAVLFSLPLEHLDISKCSRVHRVADGMSAVGLARTLQTLLLEAGSTWTEREEVDALMLNISRTSCLCSFTLSAAIRLYQLRFLCTIQQLTAVDLSSSNIDPAYLSYFVSPSGDPALLHLRHFSAARADFVQRERRDRWAEYRLNALLRFAHAYSQLHTCSLALGVEVLDNIIVVTKALSEVEQVRRFAFRVLHRIERLRPSEQHDSDEEEWDEEEAEKKAEQDEEQKEPATSRTPSASPRDAPQSLTLRWLSIMELEGVTLQDASLLIVLTGCERLRRMICRDCGEQTTAAWLLAAVKASHLISLILYAEEVKATAAAWKKASEAFPDLAHLIDPPSSSAQQPPTANNSSYPGLAHIEIRMMNAEQSDKQGFANLMNLMAAAPLTALNLHLPVNAVMGSRVHALRHMSHIQSLNIVPLPPSSRQQQEHAYVEYQQTADKIQQLLKRCVGARQQSAQQHAEWLAAGWEREIMGDGSQGGEGGGLLSQEAAVGLMVQDNEYTQGGIFSRSFTTSAGDGQMSGRVRFFHELASMCRQEED